MEYLPKTTVVKKNVEGGGSEIQKALQSALRSEGGGSEIHRGLQSALMSEGGGSEIQIGLQGALRSEGGGSEIQRGLQSALRSRECVRNLILRVHTAAIAAAAAGARA